MDCRDELYAIEAIKHVKARYWRAVDTKDAALLRSVFCDPCLIDFRGSVGGESTDAQLWRNPDRFCADMMASTIGSCPHITVFRQRSRSCRTMRRARSGRWRISYGTVTPARCCRFDVSMAGATTTDAYRKTAGGWKIAQTKITRIHIETE